MTAPTLVVFDAIETIFSLQPVRARLRGVGASELALEVWFARLLRDAFALTAAGSYATFQEVATGVLHGTLADHGVAATTDVLEDVFGAFSSLPAHDDARAALEIAADRHVPAYVLTNGTREMTTTLLETNDLSHLIGDVVTVHDVERWKPAPDPYLHVVDLAGAEPSDTALVAVHGWDILGARRAGLHTGWCARLEHHLSPRLDRPT